ADKLANSARASAKNAESEALAAEREATKAIELEGAAREGAERAIQLLRGERASDFAQRPGKEVEALVAGVQAVAPSLVHQHSVPLEAIKGLSDAVAAARFAFPLPGNYRVPESGRADPRAVIFSPGE